MHRLAYIAAIAGMTPTGALIGSLLLGGIPPVAVGFVLGMLGKRGKKRERQEDKSRREKGARRKREDILTRQ